MHRSRSDSIYTHTHLQGVAYISSASTENYKSHNFEARTMKFVLLRSESLTLQILWIEFCDS